MNQAHPQVCLRAMEPEDLDLLYRIENDKTLWDIGATNVPYSRYTLHEYISQTCGDIYTDRQVRLMIDNEEGETVGIADIVRFDPKHKRAEVGLVIERPYRRRGYASAALLHLCDYALRQLHLHQLYALEPAFSGSFLQGWLQEDIRPDRLALRRARLSGCFPDAIPLGQRRRNSEQVIAVAMATFRLSAISGEELKLGISSFLSTSSRTAADRPFPSLPMTMTPSLLSDWL